MADIAGDIEGGEVVAGLALIVVIGYFLYKFSQSACSVINSFFGLSTTSCTGGSSVGQPGGSYANAAGTVASDPIGSVESILGIGPGYPSLVGSTVIDPPSAQTGTTPAQQINQAYVTGSSL